MEAEGPEDGELRAAALLRRLQAFALPHLGSASVSADPAPKARLGLVLPPKAAARPQSGGLPMALGGVPEVSAAGARGGLGRMARGLKSRLSGPGPTSVECSTGR